MEPVVEVGLEARVDVTVVEFAVEGQEDLVCAYPSVLLGGEQGSQSDEPWFTRGAMTSASGHSVFWKNFSVRRFQPCSYAAWISGREGLAAFRRAWRWMMYWWNPEARLAWRAGWEGGREDVPA